MSTDTTFEAADRQTVGISPRGVAKALVLLIGGLIVIQSGLLTLVWGFGKTYVFGLVDMFDFGGEDNVTAYFQSLLLLSCSMVLALTASLSRPALKDRLPWGVLSGVFLFLAVDEATMIHEFVSAPMREMFHASWLPQLAWVVPYFGGLVVLAATLLPWFLRLDRPSQIRFALAGFLYVLGAVGFELLESKQVEGILAAQPDLDLATLQNRTVDFIILFEESLEMIGSGLFLYALVERLGGLTIRTRH